MRRPTPFIIVCVGLLTGLAPGCAFWNRQSVKPDPPPARELSTRIPLVSEPRWPTDPMGVDETRTFPEPLGAPAKSRLPYETSLLTSLTDRKTSQIDSMGQSGGLLGSPTATLQTPTHPPLVVPGPGAPTPPPGSVVEKKEPPPEPIVLALQDLLNEHYQQALEHLKCYDPGNQEALICLTAIIARLTKKNLDRFSPAEVAHLQNQVQKSLLAALRARAELCIETLCFCESIDGYGVYKPLPLDHEFQPRSGHQPGEQAQLYIELRNLTSQPQAGGYETRLHSTMRILDAAGKEVILEDQSKDRDSPLCTPTPRPDYFQQCYFYVPQLRPGKYLLRVEVQDVTRPEAPRTAVKTIEFRVAGPG
jgi:hypothetical protein